MGGIPLGADATGQDPTADPDADGLDNASEFAWNTDPLTMDGPRGFVRVGVQN